MERAAENDATGDGEDGAEEGGKEEGCYEGCYCADGSDEYAAEGCLPAVVGNPASVGFLRTFWREGEDGEKAKGGEHDDCCDEGCGETGILPVKTTMWIQKTKLVCRAGKRAYS